MLKKKNAKSFTYSQQNPFQKQEKYKNRWTNHLSTSKTHKKDNQHHVSIPYIAKL